jgi:hypothetical protein
MSLLRLEFLSGFLTTFFLSTKCFSCIDSSFLDSWIFLFVFLRARVEYGFHYNPPVEGTLMEQKTRVFFQIFKF